MPASIVLTAIYGSTFMAAASLGAIGLAAATFAINFAVSYLVTRAFVNKQKSQSNSVRQQVPPSTDNRLPVVYGDAWLGGAFVDAVISNDQQTMYYVMAISHISPEGQFTFDTTKFYYGDRLVTFDGANASVISLTDDAGNVDTKINGFLEINLYISSQSGVITLVRGNMPHVVMGGADIPSNLRWPSSGRQMNGLAFAIVKLKYNTDAGTTGLQPITFKVKHVQSTTGISKPGWVLKDYLSNEVYGGAVPLANINTAACDALDVYSDQTITFEPYTGGASTQARYRINGVLDTGETVLNNIDHILAACDSWISYQAETGQWAPIINKAESTTFVFDDSNIIGEIRVSATDITQSINQVEVSFPFKESKDQPATVLIETPANLLYPNEPVNKYTTTFVMVNDSVQAQYLANRMLEQAREDLIVSFSTVYTGIQVNAGEVVAVTNAAYGWTNKLFRVMKVNETSLPDGNLGARFELSEYNAQVFDDFDISQFTPSPNSGLASGYYFPPLLAPTFSDTLPNNSPPTFSVSCQLPTSVRVTTITLYYTTSAAPTQTDWKVWAIQTAPGGESFAAGASIKFTNIIVGNGTYYFAFTVGNDVSVSDLSATSSPFAWDPIIVGQTYAYWSPSSIQVPRTDNVPSFTGISYQLNLSFNLSPVNFVAAQTDSDVSFVNNTWRIGSSSSTGYGSISTTNGLVVGNPTDGGNVASFAAPTAMTGTPAVLTVPIRYKSNSGTVYQINTPSLQFIFVDSGGQGEPGDPGNQYAEAILYQWSPTQPGNPSGQSTYTWATGAHSAYTGGNGWQTTIPANPGTPGIYLWAASKAVTAVAGTVTTTVSWDSGYNIVAPSSNGQIGSKTAKAVVYRWEATLPAGPTGTSSYTWSNGTFTPNPTGWSSTITSAPSPGYTLWSATVSLIDSGTATTTTINWTLASIVAAGYSGANGATGAQARIMFARVPNNPTPIAGTVTVSGDNRPSSSQSAAVWGSAFAVTWYASDPNPSSNDSLYQSDGIYDGTNTVWSAPYISALKVGSLSAITANMGTLTAGSINTTGFIQVKGTTTLSLKAPSTLNSVNYSTSLAGNTSGNAQVGITGLADSDGVVGVYGENLNATDGPGVFGLGTVGVWGRASSTPTVYSYGVIGQAREGIGGGVYGSTGVYGIAKLNNTTAIHAKAEGSATALLVEGPIKLTNNTPTTGSATPTLSNKPGSNSSSSWLKVNIGGTDYYIPVFT